MDYADGMRKILHPTHRSESIFPGEESLLGQGGNMKNRDGFMIGRASFGNPWCFLSSGKRPVLQEILEVMELHARLLIETK